MKICQDVVIRGYDVNMSGHSVIKGYDVYNINKDVG